MRDTAFGGLAALLNQQAWRDSSAGPVIADLVSGAMRDVNPVVRMHAARAARALRTGDDPAEQVDTIGELVLTEENPTVRTVLLEQLGAIAEDAPDTVDTVLELLLEADNDVLAQPGGDLGRSVVVLLTYLALVPQTAFASRTVERWCAGAPAHAALVEAFAQCARRYLAPSSGVGQQMAFRLLGAAADASLTRWTRDPDEHRTGADLSDDQHAELRGALEVAHGIAQQIYFASDAFDEKRGQKPRHENLAGFADLAFPVLATCAGLRVAQCVHEAVQTMVFLAPLNEARALQAIASAVPAHGPYAGDILAGNVVIPYLERLLTEQRPLVLSNDHGVTAFRHLLATFAAAGNQAALSLAYTFADVFR